MKFKKFVSRYTRPDWSTTEAKSRLAMIIKNDSHFPEINGHRLKEDKKILDEYIAQHYPYRDYQNDRKPFEDCWADYVIYQKSLKSYQPEIGDRVRLDDRYYVSRNDTKRIFTVLSEPYMLCGTKVVWLSEKGAYAYNGITAIPEYVP